MFKKGQLLSNPATGAYVEVLVWPWVRLVRPGRLNGYRAGVEFHASNNFTLIGNNYKAKE